jgi:hypothetical protein
MSAHGVPSAFTQGGGGGSAAAAGASEIAAAAAPMNNAGIILDSCTVMEFGYHDHQRDKP